MGRGEPTSNVIISGGTRNPANAEMDGVGGVARRRRLIDRLPPQSETHRWRFSEAARAPVSQAGRTRCPIGDLRIELVVLGHVSDEIQKLRAERRDPQLRAVPLGPPRLVVGEQSFSHEVLLGQEPNGVVESVIQHRLDLLQLSVAAVLPLFWLRSISLGKRIREVAKKQRKQEGAMAASFTESISAINFMEAAEKFTKTAKEGDMVTVVVKRKNAEGKEEDVTLSAPAQKINKTEEHLLEFDAAATKEQLTVRNAWLNKQ